MTAPGAIVSLVSQCNRKLDELIYRKSLYLFAALIFCFGTAQAAAPDLEQRFGPRPLDGVYVEALQSYSNPRHHHLGFNFGMWPIQPYYNGFSLNLAYTYYFNKDSAWEVMNFSYLYTVDTGLTAELAEVYRVDPKSIQRVNYVISSNYLMTLAYGKFIFFENNIRYFRSSLILGPALVGTNEGSNIGVTLGWGFETFVNDRVSWKFDVRDSYAIDSRHPNNLAISVGTSYGF